MARITCWRLAWQADLNHISALIDMELQVLGTQEMGWWADGESMGTEWGAMEYQLPLEDKDASCLTNASFSSQGKPQFIKFQWCAHGSFWPSFFWWTPTPVNSLNPQLLEDSIYSRALDSAGATPALTYWDPLRSVDCTWPFRSKSPHWAFLRVLGGSWGCTWWE